MKHITQFPTLTSLLALVIILVTFGWVLSAQVAPPSAPAKTFFTYVEYAGKPYVVRWVYLPVGKTNPAKTFKMTSAAVTVFRVYQIGNPFKAPLSVEESTNMVALAMENDAAINSK